MTLNRYEIEKLILIEGNVVEGTTNCTTEERNNSPVDSITKII